MLFFCHSLTPSTRYYYQFGSNTWGWSDEFSFKSPPVTSPDSSVRIITYGGKENTCFLSIAECRVAILCVDSAVYSYMIKRSTCMSVVMWLSELLHANYIKSTLDYIIIAASFEFNRKPYSPVVVLRLVALCMYIEQ